MLKADTGGPVQEWDARSAMRDLVAATNLVGVITQGFVSSAGPLLQGVAAQIARQGSIRRADAAVRDHRLVLARYESAGLRAIPDG